jgi:hypothetical protein
MNTEKVSGRASLGRGFLALVAALLSRNTAKATGVDQAVWEPLNTGPYTRVFRQMNGKWAEIPWEEQQPGDEVIHFGIVPGSGCPLLLLRATVKDLDRCNRVSFEQVTDLASRFPADSTAKH